MKTIGIMTTFVFLSNLLWSSGSEEAFIQETSSHTAHALEANMPAPDYVTNTSSSAHISENSDTTESSEDSEDSEELLNTLRGLNALNLSVPRLQYTSRAEQFSLQYDLCCHIQKLQNQIKDFEYAQHRIQIYYQNKFIYFQREMNRLSQCISQKNIENKDLIRENERLRTELIMQQTSSSTQEKDTSSDSSSDVSSFSDEEDYLGNVKALSTQHTSFARRSSKHTSSSAADFGIPPLDLQELMRHREGENY